MSKIIRPIIINNMNRTNFSACQKTQHLKAFDAARKGLRRHGLYIKSDDVKHLQSLQVASASDHAGFTLKQRIFKCFKALGVNYYDFGPANKPEGKIDYPVYAAPALDSLNSGYFDRVVLVCGTGMGMEIIANKFPGVRSALAGNPKSILLARKHSDINAIAFGEWTCPTLAKTYENLFGFFFVDFLKQGANYARRLDEVRAIASSAQENSTLPLFESPGFIEQADKIPELSQVFVSTAMYFLEKEEFQPAIAATGKYIGFGKNDPNRSANLLKLYEMINKLTSIPEKYQEGIDSLLTAIEFEI